MGSFLELAKAEEAEHEEGHDNETDEVDDGVHGIGSGMQKAGA
jgi:hypothetical protein